MGPTLSSRKRSRCCCSASRYPFLRWKKTSSSENSGTIECFLKIAFLDFIRRLIKDFGFRSLSPCPLPTQSCGFFMSFAFSGFRPPFCEDCQFWNGRRSCLIRKARRFAWACHRRGSWYFFTGMTWWDYQSFGWSDGFFLIFPRNRLLKKIRVWGQHC